MKVIPVNYTTYRHNKAITTYGHNKASTQRTQQS